MCEWWRSIFDQEKDSISWHPTSILICCQKWWWDIGSYLWCSTKLVPQLHHIHWPTVWKNHPRIRLKQTSLRRHLNIKLRCVHNWGSEHKEIPLPVPDLIQPNDPKRVQHDRTGLQNMGLHCNRSEWMFGDLSSLSLQGWSKADLFGQVFILRYCKKHRFDWFASWLGKWIGCF